MDNTIRNRTRPTGPQQPASARPTGQSDTAKTRHIKWYKKAPFLALLTTCLLLIGFGVWWALTQRGPAIMYDRYQAVFLDDGKVFFGKLKNTQVTYLTLENAYYTQDQAASSDDKATLQATGQVNIVKVGEEVYGPEDRMAIRADQVLFWQNLTTDNQIVKAIESQNN